MRNEIAFDFDRRSVFSDEIRVWYRAFNLQRAGFRIYRERFCSGVELKVQDVEHCSTSLKVQHVEHCSTTLKVQHVENCITNLELQHVKHCSTSLKVQHVKHCITCLKIKMSNTVVLV